MNRRVSASGLWALSKTGSLLFCKNCGKIVGSINKQGYRFLKLSLICTCGCFGNIEVLCEDSTSDFLEHQGRMPNFKDSVAICKECSSPIFGVIENRVENYSFYAECICGAKYDTKPRMHKRLGETAMLLKNGKKDL